jgi:hypothetical protein
MIPPYETLKTAMIKVQQDAELASERAAKGSKIPSYNTGLRQNQQNKKTPKFTGGCWDCSQPNCKMGHQGCRSPGELNFAPDRIREKNGLPPRQNHHRLIRHRTPKATIAVVVETPQTKSTKSARFGEGMLAQEVTSVIGFTHKANKENPGK